LALQVGKLPLKELTPTAPGELFDVLAHQLERVRGQAEPRSKMQRDGDFRSEFRALHGCRRIEIHILTMYSTDE
jgi:hypothetical protein